MKAELKEIPPSNHEAQELFQLLDEHNLSYCPPEVCHLTQPEQLENINSVLLGVYCGETLVGMGGLKLYVEYAEITRMFIKPIYRGNGFAVQLLEELETIAKSKNYKLLKLETSDKFKSAYRLYLRYGFEICAPFGEYIHKAHNTYMEKKISPNR